MTIKESVQPIAASSFARRVYSQGGGVSTMKSVQVIARIAAVLYLVTAVASGVAHGYVPATLIVPGDAAATASHRRRRLSYR